MISTPRPSLVEFLTISSYCLALHTRTRRFVEECGVERGAVIASWFSIPYFLLPPFHSLLDIFCLFSIRLKRQMPRGARAQRWVSSPCANRVLRCDRKGRLPPVLENLPPHDCFPIVNSLGGTLYGSVCAMHHCFPWALFPFRLPGIFYLERTPGVIERASGRRRHLIVFVLVF